MRARALYNFAFVLLARAALAGAALIVSVDNVLAQQAPSPVHASRLWPCQSASKTSQETAGGIHWYRR